jgi:hypothetical protein
MIKGRGGMSVGDVVDGQRPNNPKTQESEQVTDRRSINHNHTHARTAGEDDAVGGVLRVEHGEACLLLQRLGRHLRHVVLGLHQLLLPGVLVFWWLFVLVVCVCDGGM